MSNWTSICEASSCRGNEVRAQNTAIVFILALISLCIVAPAVGDDKVPATEVKNPLYDVVVRGILENCRKFDCGALAWQAEQKQRVGTSESSPATGQRYVSRMWWDGEKVAINGTSWKITAQRQKDEGEKGSTYIKVFDGSEYRGLSVGTRTISLEKKPRFGQFENYLNDYGWPGYAQSIVERLAGNINTKRANLEWSVAEADGDQKIKAKLTYEGSANYYELYYFDGSKSCMWYQQEIYANNELTYACTWTLKEVSKGMWFPAEGNQHGKVRTPNGEITYTTSLAVDLQKSSFNDHSAIPEGTFRLEITPDIATIIDHRLGEPPTIYRGNEVDAFLKRGRQEWSVLVSEGTRLPGFNNIGINLDADQIENKMVLGCFFDMNQRPSRNYIQQLSKRAQELRVKGVVVVAVQASKVDQGTLDEWVKKNNILFPVGMVQGDEEKTRLTWGVKALPWLILTDKKHVVVAEGFSLADLDAKIAEIQP